MRVLNKAHWPHRIKDVPRPSGWCSESSQLDATNKDNVVLTVFDPRIDWCREHVKSRWITITPDYGHGDDFYFTDQFDALMFALRWV